MNRYLYRKLLEHRDEDGIDSRVDNELISESKLSLLNNFAKDSCFYHLRFYAPIYK